MSFCIRTDALLSLEAVIVHHKEKQCQRMSNDISDSQIKRFLELLGPMV